jgi:hypothetical protein
MKRIGRVGSANPPNDLKDGALGESALPNPTLPNPQPTTSKKP